MGLTFNYASLHVMAQLKWREDKRKGEILLQNVLSSIIQFLQVLVLLLGFFPEILETTSISS